MEPLRVNNIIEKICLPDSKYFKEEHQRRALLTKNKSRFQAILAFLVVIVVYMTCLASSRETYNLQLLFYLHLIMLLIFIITCRSKPSLYESFFLAIYNIGGYLLTQTAVTNGIGCAIIGNSISLWILYFTQKRLYFIITSVVQVLLSYYIYIPNAQQGIIDLGTEWFVSSTSKSLMIACAFNSIIIVGICNDMQSYQSKYKDISSENRKTFLLSFSHELRNLMNNIMGNIQLTALEADLSEKQQQFLYNAQACGEILLQSINNILDTGKNEVGELEVNYTGVDMNELLRKIWGVSSVFIKRKSLLGSFTYSKNIPSHLKLDSYRLVQVMLNLVSNAVKYTNKGKVDICLQWKENQESVDEECFEPQPFDDEGQYERNIKFTRFLDDYKRSLSGNATYFQDFLNFSNNVNQQNSPSTLVKKGVLKISVLDTGCGIPEQMIEKIYDKFGQYSNNKYAKELGTGLGLHITRELCKKMGGEIRAYSKLNQGSAFIICLPTEVAPPPPGGGIDSPALKSHSQKKSGPQTIFNPSHHFSSLEFMRQQQAIRESPDEFDSGVIIVDDDEFCRQLHEYFFTRLGVPPRYLGKNGQQALDLYIDSHERGNQLSIIVIDIQMPIMDGKEAIRKIRKYEATHKLRPAKVIFISGNCSESVINECMDKNGDIRAYDFLKKPITIDDIKQTIEKL